MAVAQPTAGIAPRPSRLQNIWKSISIVFDSRVCDSWYGDVLFWVVFAIISLFWTLTRPMRPILLINTPMTETDCWDGQPGT